MIPNTEEDIKQVTNEVAEMLISKNRAYGDSALTPKRIFSRADMIEQLKVRIDDKLSRLMSMVGDVDAMGEDVEKDLMGYLVLLRIARLRKARGTQRNGGLKPNDLVLNGGIKPNDLVLDNQSQAAANPPPPVGLYPPPNTHGELKPRQGTVYRVEGEWHQGQEA